MVLYAYLRPVHYILQMLVVAVCALIACLHIWTDGRGNRQFRKGSQESVSKIVLLDDDGERIKEWLVRTETSVVIGKSSSQSEVDIDLSDCEYASLISPEHAVLNRVGDSWYIEDADSQSGTGIRKAGRSDTRRLSEESPEPLGYGDMIFIANTRLLMK
ncbi:FHA domain-containing protein [Paenibacillus sp. CAA11]|nr:FHA domain-containing protein [Paenibacillus sp. CAA11]